MTVDLLNRVLERILIDEGGVSDHVSDRGGLTAFGLTKPFLRDVTSRDWTDDDVRGLTKEKALAVYRLWAQIRRLDQLPEDFLFAWFVIDYAVHSGVRTAIRATQLAMGIHADGIAGAETQGAWHSLGVRDRKLIAASVLVKRMEHIGRIVKADPSQAVFIVGWLRRLGEQVKACAA